jgi:hypothetical protein
MPSKIEGNLKPEQFWDFCARVAQMNGGRKGAKLVDIQTLAAEWGIEVSLESARTFRKGAFADYLSELQAKREMAENVSTIAKNGIGLSDATAAVLSEKIFDQALRLDTHADDASDQANALSLSISRLRTGDQRARYLDGVLEQMRTKMMLQQLDAAKIVLEQAKELRAIVQDKSLDQGAKLERVRLRLFGAAPADFKPAETRGAQAE